MSVHATTVAVRGEAIVIMGPPGSGKSELALALIDQPGFGLGPDLLRAALVADDQTILINERGRLIASCPPPLKGRIEIRGLGILGCDHVENVPVSLAVLLGAEDERLPEPSFFEHAGVRVRQIRMKIPDPAKVRAAFSAR